jgi:hypothetical protein
MPPPAWETLCGCCGAIIRTPQIYRNCYRSIIRMHQLRTATQKPDESTRADRRMRRVKDGEETKRQLVRICAPCV